MHENILTKEQVELLPFVNRFYKKFGLVGGTAIALQIGHRESIDFDLFSYEKFSNYKIRKEVEKHNLKIQKTYQDELGQFTFIINNVQFTFFQYPFEINYEIIFQKNVLKMPNLLILAAMKAYALGRRAKWKDYVDLYFIMNKFYNINEIISCAKNIFKGEFNSKIFKEQLAYFADINYSEKIEYLDGFAVDDKEIMKKLIEFSLEH